jgi:hypothetical protein
MNSCVAGMDSESSVRKLVEEEVRLV